MPQTITITEFCRHHSIETSFVHRLREQGLLSHGNTSDADLSEEELALAERLVRLHYDLHINLEGLEVVQHLLERMEAMQCEVSTLRNRLRFYEESEGR